MLSGEDTRSDRVNLALLVAQSLRESKPIGVVAGVRKKRSQVDDYGPFIQIEGRALKSVSLTHMGKVGTQECIEFARLKGSPEALGTVAAGLRLFALITQEEAVDLLQEALRAKGSALGRNKARTKLRGIMTSVAFLFLELDPEKTGFRDYHRNSEES